MFQSNHVNNNIGTGMNTKYSGGYNYGPIVSHRDMKTNPTPISMQPLVTFQDPNQGFIPEEVQSLFGHSPL